MKTFRPLNVVVHGLIFTVCLALMLSTVHAAEPTPVLVVGMYHMNNPGRDQYNLAADNVLAPKRQAEIEEFVRMLAEFKPTKICLEIPFSAESDELGKAKRRKDPGYDARYPEYLRGELEESASEIYQIGFRLAKLMGHDKVYAVDAKTPFGGYRWNAVKTFAGDNGLQEIIETSDALLNAMVRDYEEMLGRMTVTEYLHEHNQPKNILDLQRAYTDRDGYISVDHDYIGPDMMAAWYGRNVRIFSNVTRITNSDDRILVLFGAGHVNYLRQLFDESANYELLDTNSFF